VAKVVSADLKSLTKNIYFFATINIFVGINMVLVLVILCVLLLVWYVYNHKAASAEHYSEKINCGSPQVLQAAKSYHDGQSSYLMDVISSTPGQGANSCNIKFQPIPYPGAKIGVLKNKEVDARQFQFAYSPEGWRVTTMEGPRSGF
jgi:hypothetical protein